MKRRFLAWVLLIFLFVGMISTKVSAVQTGNFLQGYSVIGDNLIVRSAQLPKNGKLTMTINGNALDTDIKTAEEAEDPVTVYCLVDVSKSISAAQINLVKSILSSINQHMNGNDQMVIAMVANQTQASGILQTEQERDEAIASIKNRSEYTNLYSGIVTSIEELKTSTNYHHHKCLLIFSDGVDEHAAGYTLEEAADAVQDSGIPVYTVNLLYSSSGDNRTQSAKALGSISRSSCGGLNIAPLIEKISAEDAAKNIWESMANGLYILSDIGDISIDRSRSIQDLLVTYTTDGAVYEDILEIRTEDFPEEKSVQTQPPTEKTEPDSTTSEPTEPIDIPKTPRMNTIVYSFIGLFLLIALSIAVTLVLLRRRKNNNVLPTIAEDVPQIDSKPIVLPATTCTIQMIALHRPELSKEFKLVHERKITLGRDQRAELVLNSRDMQLSGVHCQLYAKKGQLYIRDVGSTNGTYVNGVMIPKNHWSHISHGDCVSLGSYQYRILIQFEN